MSSHSNREAGFSLVEVMISMTLLGIAVLGMAYMQTQQQQSHGSTQHQMRLRQTMQEIASRVSSRSGEFPIIDNSSGTLAMTYIACFNDDGTPRPRANQANGFVGEFLPQGTDHTKPYANPGNGSLQVCPLDQGG